MLVPYLKSLVSGSSTIRPMLTSFLERKAAVLNGNSKVVLSHGKTIASETKAVSSTLNDFVETSSSNLQKLLTEAQQFRMKETHSLAAHSKRIDQQLQRVQNCAQDIRGKDETSNEAITAIQALVKETQETFKNGFVAWSEGVKKSNESLCNELEKNSEAGFGSVRD
jgi:kinesin family protein 11